MARRKSLAADLVSIIALLPWWLCLLLAPVGYLVLHPYAAMPVAVSTGTGQIAAGVSAAMIKALANAGQYVVPVLFLLAAGVSAWKRRERQQLLMSAANARTADVLEGISWQQFEQLVAEVFRRQGYSVDETGGGGADGGIDLLLRRGGERFVVQCKQWRALKVGVDVVRELYGVMAASGATGGWVVSSGRYTKEAVRFASGRNITLIDGVALQRWIKELGPVSSAANPSAALDESPVCPACGQPMVRRVARRGSQSGQAFWGCAGYPACKGTRTLS